MELRNEVARSLPRLLLAILFLAPVANITPCFAGSPDEKASIEEVKKETADLIAALKAYTADQREEAAQKTRAALGDLDQRIDALEARVDRNWNEMSETARTNARETLKVLRQKRIEAAERYGSLKTSSRGAWTQMKKGFSNAYRDLSRAWQKAQEEFASDG